MNNRVDHPNLRTPLSGNQAHGALDQAQETWIRVFRDLQGELDASRSPDYSTESPSHLAVTVVVEALAVAVALGDALDDALKITSSGPSGVAEAVDAENPRSTAIYAEMDCRYLDHRTKALRNAISAVDDYIWWGGLGRPLPQT